MQINKLLHQIGISSSLLIGTLNAEITITRETKTIPGTTTLLTQDIQDLISFLENIKKWGVCISAPIPELKENYSTPEIYQYYNDHCCKSKHIKLEDKDIINRVLNNDTEVPAVLFVGFDQWCQTEGSKIKYNTPGYEKSIFTSSWEKRPEHEFNNLKTDFFDYPKLLELFPKLQNFFDYIIIGGQTSEYIPAETWQCFGKMLKTEGIILFNPMVKNFDGKNVNIQNFIEYFVAKGSTFTLKSFECLIDDKSSFNNNSMALEKKLLEALELSKFNDAGSSGSDSTLENVHSYGDFFFAMRPIKLHVIQKTVYIHPIDPIF